MALDPVRINKIQPNKYPQCWRDCGQKGTTIHIGWDCPKIKEYWQLILENIGEIAGEKIAQNPWIVLFHGTTKTKKQYKETLVPPLLNAAKGLIPK